MSSLKSKTQFSCLGDMSHICWTKTYLLHSKLTLQSVIKLVILKKNTSYKCSSDSHAFEYLYYRDKLYIFVFNTDKVGTWYKHLLYSEDVIILLCVSSI